MNAYLLLANGMVFAGQSVGAQGVTVGEVAVSYTHLTLPTNSLV